MKPDTSPRTHLWRALALLAVTMSLVLSPLAAYAAWNDNGPGNTGGTGGSGTGNGTNYDCGQNIGLLSGALYLKTGGHWVMQYDATYPNCVSGSSKFSGSGPVQLCLAGYEVYRFYATTPTAAPTVTRSRLNLPAWCAGETTYTFAAQTNWDDRPTVAPGSPDYVASGTNADQTAQKLPAAVGRREIGTLTSATPAKITTKSCASVSQANPMIAWWATATPAEQVNYRAFIGNAFYDMATVGKYTYPLTAAHEYGMSSLSGYKYSTLPDQGLFPGRAPTPNTKGANYYAKKFTFETRPCETPWNFAKVTKVTANANGSTTSTVTSKGGTYGTCYIPVIHQAKQMVSASGTKKWAFQALDRGFGERYSSYYAQKGKGGVGLAVPLVRAVMKADYAKRTLYGTLGQALKPGQVPPGDGDKAKIFKASTYSAAQSAADLSKYAKCKSGTAIALELSGDTTTTNTPSGASVHLSMSDPTVLQSGGGSYRATYTVTAGQSALVCTANCASATLTSVSYTLGAGAPGGYRQCTAGQAVGCDFRVVSSVTGTVNTPGSIVVEFYNGTGPAQGFAVTVSQLSATYSYLARGNKITITGIDPVTGQPYSRTTGSTTTTKFVTVTPVLVATPTPAVFNRAAGTYTVTLPVISAVNVPR